MFDKHFVNVCEPRNSRNIVTFCACTTRACCSRKATCPPDYSPQE